MEHKGETAGAKLILDGFKFVGISGSDRIPNYEAYSNFDLTDVKYNIYKQQREGNVKVSERIGSNSFKYSENMK
jgi:hypothetical protein